MNNKIVSLLFLFTSLWGFSQEQNSRSFTLQEAIDYALDSSYAAINARRDLAKAIKQKWETTAQGLPQIDASVGYNNNLKQPVTLIPAEFMGGAPGTYYPVKFGTDQSMNAVATLNQLIFDGSYLVGLKAAKTFQNYSENANEKTRLEVRKGVINAYGSVLLAQELVEVLERNKTNLEKNVREARLTFENGLEEEESVEQLEITLLDITTQLDNALRSLNIAKQMFNLSLGIDVDANTTLTDDLDALAQDNISLELLDRRLELEKTVDFKMANNLVEQRFLEMRLEQSKALPSLAAFINYGASSFGEHFDFFKKDQKWYQQSIFGVNLQIPIFSSGKRHAATQRTRIALDQAKTDFEEATQQIRLNLTSAKSNYRFAIDKFENSKRNLELAERVERKNQMKFEEGISSSFELRQAQLQLYSAQQQYFQSMLDLINEKANLETALNIPQLRISTKEIKKQQL